MVEKQVAVITGGSRGIGRACAIELAKAGFDIAIVYAGNEAAANSTVSELKELNSDASAYKFDISDENSVNDGIAAIIEKYGRIDVLINNAGITRDGLFVRMNSADWGAVINTNLTGAYNVSKPVVKLMMKQRSGSIVNISSIVGIMGNAGQANYSAAKAGLIGFTKSLAKELGTRNIRVNAIAPGFVQTDMTKGLDSEKMSEHIPLKRLGVAEDIAVTAKFLAVDGTYITGQVIGVDGGLVI
ncbi:3-oxoacyl-[bacterium]|nr:3-oxoacyl-[acyl-carrier-protein] reductase [bacterium]